MKLLRKLAKLVGFIAAYIALCVIGQAVFNLVVLAAALVFGSAVAGVIKMFR